MRSEKIRRYFLMIMALGLTALLVGVFTPSAQAGKAKKTIVTVSGGPVGGTAYMIYSAMAAIVSQYSDTVRVVCEGGGGTSENYARIERGDLDAGQAIQPTCYEAYSGTGMYQGKKAHEHLRFLTFDHYATYWLCTLKKSGLKSLSDLKGKRISPGPPGTSATVVAERVLKANGLDVEKDCKVTYLTYGDCVKALRDGSIDAGYIFGGSPTAPSSAVVDLMSTSEVRLIPLVDKAATEATNAPGAWIVIPKGTVRGTEVDTPATAVLCFCTIRDTVPDDVAYEMLKQWLTHLPKFYKAHPVCRHLTLDRVFTGANIPVHPGAIRYYKEAGLWDKRPEGVQ